MYNLSESHRGTPTIPPVGAVNVPPKIQKSMFLKIFWGNLYFLSYLMYNLSEWHHGTPTVPPVGAVNVPPNIRKIQKFSFFILRI